MSDIDWIDEILEDKSFIHYGCGTEADPADGFGKCTCGIKEELSQAKAAINKKLNEARIEAATHCKEIQPVTDGMKFERWNDRIDSYIEALQATKEKL